MAKKPKSKRINSEAILAKKSAKKTKQLNPFEVHLNNEKFKILGRKCKHDRGLPGVSRAKAIKKRKETLGQEFQEFGKVNKFKDRRIGGNSGNWNDDIAIARFTAEKMSQLKANKKDIFNLNDDETLTHRGRTLEEIEQYNDPVSDESEEDETLDAEFTQSAHFGGEDGKQDRKAAIEEMIAEAKRKKAEIAKDKNEVFDLTSKLDENYKHLLPLFGKLTKNEDIPKPPPDSYDRALREMIFEPRGEVTDRLKSDNELKNQEEKRLKKLEEERLARMRGDDIESSNKATHRSADDLDDGFFLDSEDEDNGVLAYSLDGNSSTAKTKSKEQLEDDDNEISDNEEIENDLNILKNEKLVNGESASEEEQEDMEDGEAQENIGDEKESEDESDAEEDNFSDLKEDSESEEGDINENANSKEDCSTDENDEIEEKVVVPTFLEIPKIYDDFMDLLKNYSPEGQQILVERMIKSNHPKLDPLNKEKISQMFAFLLQYLNDAFSNDKNEDAIKHNFRIFDKLSPHLYDITEMNVEKCSNIILEVIKEKYANYRKNPRVIPPLSTLIFFKLISNIYSTSDFRHRVVTSCFIFISHILSRSKVKAAHEISLGLFLCTIVLEYTAFSKRFLPAVYNYFLGVIFLAVLKKPIEIIKICPPFESTGPQNNLLALHKDCSNNYQEIKEEKLTSHDLLRTKEISDTFKIRILNTTLKLIEDAMKTVQDNVGSCYFAEPFLQMMERLNMDFYPEFVKKSFQNTKELLELILKKPLRRLVAQEKKPKALRLFEPKIVKVTDDKRRPKLSKQKEERAIMLHKVKRETKGALREIRRDTAFLAKMRIKQQIQSDLERKEKVRKIFSDAALQQGELNAMSRKKTKF